MTFWVDKKIDLMVEFLRKEYDTVDVHEIVCDIQTAFDSARAFPIDDKEVYRARANKILVCVKIVERRATGFDLGYLQDLEGVLIDILRGADTKA